MAGGVRGLTSPSGVCRHVSSLGVHEGAAVAATGEAIGLEADFEEDADSDKDARKYATGAVPKGQTGRSTRRRDDRERNKEARRSGNGMAGYANTLLVRSWLDILVSAQEKMASLGLALIFSLGLDCPFCLLSLSLAIGHSGGAQSEVAFLRQFSGASTFSTLYHWTWFLKRRLYFSS